MAVFFHILLADGRRWFSAHPEHAAWRLCVYWRHGVELTACLLRRSVTVLCSSTRIRQSSAGQPRTGPTSSSRLSRCVSSVFSQCGSCVLVATCHVSSSQ